MTNISRGMKSKIKRFYDTNTSTEDLARPCSLAPYKTEIYEKEYYTIFNIHGFCLVPYDLSTVMEVFTNEDNSAFNIKPFIEEIKNGNSDYTKVSVNIDKIMKIAADYGYRFTKTGLKPLKQTAVLCFRGNENKKSYFNLTLFDKIYSVISPKTNGISDIGDSRNVDLYFYKYPKVDYRKFEYQPILIESDFGIVVALPYRHANTSIEQEELVIEINLPKIAEDIREYGHTFESSSYGNIKELEPYDDTAVSRNYITTGLKL